MISKYKITLENIIQFATVLLQTIGLFILKPDIFNFQGAGELFPGGNIYYFILIFISIAFLFIGSTYSKSNYANKWFFVFLISGILFIVSFFCYNNIVEKKTILFPLNNASSARYIKGHRFSSDITECANAIKKEHPDITEIEIIKTCSNVTDISQLINIWPETEIKENIKSISIWYCIAITFASITLISGLQSLKCKRIKT